MDIDLTSVFLAITVLAGLGYLMLKDSSKKVNAEMLGIIAVGALVLTGVAYMGWLGTSQIQTVAPGTPGTPGLTAGIPADAGIATIVTDDTPRIIDNLNVRTTEESSGKKDQCGGSVLYFDSSEDPRLSTSYSIDTTTIASGVGTDTSGQVETNTLYHIVFTNSSSPPTHYDGVLGANVWDPSDALTPIAIKAPATTDAEVSAIVKFGEDGTARIGKIATIPDILDETSTDGRINGQSNVSGEAGSTNELCVGTDTTPADDDTIYYNETAGGAIADGSFYIRMTFGAEGSQAYLKRPVLCFVNDMGTNQCERNEFTAITAALYTGSGSDVTVPSDLLPAFNNMPSCVEIGGQSIDGVAIIESGKTATYTMTFTVDHAFTESTDQFYIIQDDLADYNGQDIRQGMGAATTGKYVTIGF